MQLLLLLVSLEIALAAQEFALIVLRASSSFQYNAIFADHDALMIGQLNGLRLRLNDDGTLSTVDRKKNVYLDDRNQLVLGSKALGGFVIKNDYLINGARGLFACFGSNNKIALGIDCENGASIALRVLDNVNVESGELNPSTPTNKPSAVISAETKEPPKQMLATPDDSNSPSSDINDFYSQPGDTVKFGVIVLKPNSQFQYNFINKVAALPDRFTVGGYRGLAIRFVLRPDGTLVDQYDIEVFVNPETGFVGSVDSYGMNKATKGFSIYNSRLLLNQKSIWRACPVGRSFVLGTRDCVGGTSIGVRVVHPERS